MEKSLFDFFEGNGIVFVEEKESLLEEI